MRSRMVKPKRRKRPKLRKGREPWRPRDKAAMPRKHAPESENHERWLISYADFITLLFAFFVVMFASSQADKSKAQRVSDSVKNALEGKHASATIAAILGGAVDVKGQGNAEMKGPGGVAEPAAKKRE